MTTLRTLDRSQLDDVTGGGQIVHGVQNAKTGARAGANAALW